MWHKCFTGSSEDFQTSQTVKTRFERDTDLALAYREERYNPPSLSKDIRYTVHTTGNSSKSKTLLLK